MVQNCPFILLALSNAGLIRGLYPANKRHCYKVTLSLIDCANLESALKFVLDKYHPEIAISDKTNLDKSSQSIGPMAAMYPVLCEVW